MPRRTYGPHRRRPTTYGGDALQALAHHMSTRSVGYPAPAGTPEPRHRDWCTDPATRLVIGNRGDELARCATCQATRPLPTP